MPSAVQRKETKRYRWLEQILDLMDIATHPMLEYEGNPFTQGQVMEQNSVGVKERHGLLSPLKLVTEELKGSIYLPFSETVKDKGTIEGRRPKQTHVLIVIEDTSPGSLEGIISASIFGMGNDDVLSEQVERLIEHLAHLAFMACNDQIRGIDHHLQVRGLHRVKQRVALCCCTHDVCPLWFKGQGHLLFLGDAQSGLHRGQQI